MEKAAIIERIKKILALAKGTTCLEEAEAAMERVRELLAKYNLEMTDIESADFENYGCSEEVVDLSKLCFTYETNVALAMAKMFNVRYIIDKRDEKVKFRFIGVGADPIVAAQTFTFLKEGMKRAFKKLKIAKKDVFSFYLGYSVAVMKKAEMIAKQYEKAETGLMLSKNAAISKYIDKEYGRLGRRATQTRVGSAAGYNSGYEAGKNASFSRGMGGALRLTA